ncbi:unnamed protein product [Acanthocheilonema viteae]|uniref:DUF7038 domain-containing protein n=1 Tax=Acanthocheilonema viteae TaxID=6277 RepID=A0A498SQX9_ACAVI|nr:unnamed protein product [Acanthocheilonema viteae]
MIVVIHRVAEFWYVSTAITYENYSSSMRYIETVAAIPCRLDNNFEQYVWSPHFEWILDDDGIFNHENVAPNIVYVIWIELLSEPFNLNSNVLTKVTEIVRPAYDQLPIYDAPWVQSEIPVDAELLSVHCLQCRPKDKINPAAKYSGLVICRDMIHQQKQVVLWSVATGIVYFRHERCQNIAIGAWIDFSVRIGRDGVLEAHKLRYSENQMVLTREVKGRAQICQKMKIPENLPGKDWVWVSDVVGNVWIELEHFKKTVADRWDELAGSITRVWFSCDKFHSAVLWKFHSIVEPNEYTETIEGCENIECFADLVIL